MKWIFRLILWLGLLAGLAWVALVLIAPGQITKALDTRFAGQIRAGSVGMSFTGQVTLEDVTLTLPDAPAMTLARLTLRPVWQKAGLGVQLDAADVKMTIPEDIRIAGVTGLFFPASRRAVQGPFDLALRDVTFTQGSLATARLRGQVDGPAQELTRLVFNGTGLDLDVAVPLGALDLMADAVTLTTNRLSPALMAPLAIELTGVTGDVLQGPARLWVAGLKDAQVTVDTLEMPLDQDRLDLILRAETTAPTTPPLVAWIETDTQLILSRAPGCGDITCVQGVQGLVSKNSWEVAAGEDSTRGGFTCPALPCLPGSLRFAPLEVSDVQAFATGLGATRTLSPFVLGFVAAELSKVAREN